MRSLVDALSRVIVALTAVMMATLMAVMLAQVFFRYVLNSSLQWSEDVAIWLLIWIVFLGGVAVMRDWAHVYLPMAIRSVPLQYRGFCVLAAQTITAAILVFLVVIGIDVVLHGFHRQAPMLGISTRWLKLAIPVGAGLMLVMLVVRMFDAVRALRQGNHEAFRNYGSPDGL